MADEKISLNISKKDGIKSLAKNKIEQKLRSKSLYRAINGIQNVGTPHDWKIIEKYKEEIKKDEPN